MLEPPAASEFPGTGSRRATASAPAMQSQNHWINSLKSDCNFCHQLGNQLTRSVDHVLKAKPELKTHAEAWEWRLGTGVRGTSMYGVLTNQGQTRVAQDLRRLDRARRQGRSAAGAAAAEGRRAQPGADAVGLGHGPLVHARRGLHRQEPPDGERRRPGLRGVGRPRHARRCSTRRRTAPRRSRSRRARRAQRCRRASRSRTGRRCSWGDEHLWANPPYNPADPHNPMLDSKGRVWMTSKIRPNANPAWCIDPTNKFAAWFPLRSSGRQASFYDPKTQAVRAHRHLLRHAPPAVRQRRERDACTSTS